MLTLGEDASLIEPGRAYEYEIDLWATSNVFRAGHRIRLDVTSSNFPRWDRNPNTGHEFGADTELAVAHQTILHDREHPSYVVLPIVPVRQFKPVVLMVSCTDAANSGRVSASICSAVIDSTS